MSGDNQNMSGDDEDLGQYNDLGFKDNRVGAMGDNNIRLPIIDHIEK